MFSKRGDGRSFDKFGISREGSPMDFSGAQKLWKDAAPLNGKTFSFYHLSTFYKTMAHSPRFSTGFGTPLDFYVLFLIASINLESPR